MGTAYADNRCGRSAEDAAMAPTSRDRRNGPNRPATPSTLGRRELVVVTGSGVGLRAGAVGLSSAAGANIESLSDILDRHGAQLRPLFGASEERVAAAVASLPNI